MPRRRSRSWLFAALAGGCFLALAPLSARADDPHFAAEELSNGAFVLLGSVASNADQVRGAIAGFAGDAQTLASELGAGQREQAASAMAALVGDEKSVDEALAKNPGALDVARWRSLKAELAALEKRVPAAERSASSAMASGSHSPGVVAPPPESTSMLGPPPKVEITYRVWEHGGLRIRGYFEGQDLSSAGIYDGDTLLAPVKTSDLTGYDRVNFDFRLGQVNPGEVVRVTDSVGRTAQALVAPEAAVAATPDATSHDKMIELGAGPVSPPMPEPPPVVASKGANTVEIPSKSPSRRRIHRDDNLSPLSGVQINILGVVPSPGDRYQVIGQISGEGVRRAGIYVDGRLVKSIPVAAGQYTSFHVAFVMLGKRASIRVYGNGNNYVESELDLSSTFGGVYTLNPPVVPVNPYAYGTNPYAPAYPYGYGYPVNPYGSANPYAPAPYGYGPPLNGYPRAPSTGRLWPFR